MHVVSVLIKKHAWLDGTARATHLLILRFHFQSPHLSSELVYLFFQLHGPLSHAFNALPVLADERLEPVLQRVDVGIQQGKLRRERQCALGSLQRREKLLQGRRRGGVRRRSQLHVLG